MPDFAVRLATLDEAADVADVLHEAFESYRPQYTAAAFAATTPSAAEVGGRWHDGPVWVAGTAAHGHDCIVLSTTPFLYAALHDGEATLIPASSFSSG